MRLAARPARRRGRRHGRPLPAVAAAGRRVSARARQIAGSGGGEELVAAEIRVALDELGKVAGAVYSEDVLDRIFSRFCVGK